MTILKFQDLVRTTSIDDRNKYYVSELLSKQVLGMQINIQCKADIKKQLSNSLFYLTRLANLSNLSLNDLMEMQK